jgi:hypothetical protein
MKDKEGTVERVFSYSDQQKENIRQIFPNPDDLEWCCDHLEGITSTYIRASQWSSKSKQTRKKLGSCYHQIQLRSLKLVSTLQNLQRMGSFAIHHNGKLMPFDDLIDIIANVAEQSKNQRQSPEMSIDTRPSEQHLAYRRYLVEVLRHWVMLGGSLTAGYNQLLTKPAGPLVRHLIAVVSPAFEVIGENPPTLDALRAFVRKIKKGEGQDASALRYILDERWKD